MRAAYTGVESLTFMDYVDAGTGRTLTAVPGGVYEVVPVAARPVPDVPPGFVPVDGEISNEDEPEVSDPNSAIDCPPSEEP